MLNPAVSRLAVALVIAAPLFGADSASVPAKADVLALMERVADWQLANPPSPAKRPTDDWVQAAGYTGFMALSEISSSPRFFNAMLKMGEGNQWKPGKRIYFADDHCVIQTYAELYFKKHDAAMIAPSVARFDQILADPKPTGREFTRADRKIAWWWCDALFMGPPAWIRMWKATDKEAYLNYAVENWGKCSNFLYDKEEHLFYRDGSYFDKREANGKKVFWSRGNGWVLGGLARTIPYLPKDHPWRARLEEQFREMAARLVELQQPDGFWHSSLLDPASYPAQEESGTGFFCFGLTWGINEGLLDRATYLPAAMKAWQAIVSCVQPDGKLIHVQPVGADPKKFDPNSTEPYGVGALLLAGREMYRLGQ